LILVGPGSTPSTRFGPGPGSPGRFVIWTKRTSTLEDPDHRLVQGTVAGEDLLRINLEMASLEIADLPARLLDHEITRGHVPRKQVQLPKTIIAAVRHVTKVDRGHAIAPDRLGLHEEILEVIEIVVLRLPDVVGEAGRQHGAVQVVDLADGDFFSVQGRPR